MILQETEDRRQETEDRRAPAARARRVAPSESERGWGPASIEKCEQKTGDRRKKKLEQKKARGECPGPFCLLSPDSCLLTEPGMQN